MFIALLLLLIAMLIFPIKFGLLRAATVAVVGVLWIDGLFLFHRHRPIVFVFLAGAALLIVISVWPGDTRSSDLRADYVKALTSYEGKPYLWGAESRLAVDCSGLVRCALMDANINYSLRHFRPAMLREALSLWWNDSSAQAMRDGYRNRTRFIATAPSLNKFKHSLILPGDIAVTSDGQHVLAYLGNKVWIEADPKPMKVIRVRVPAPDNGWFRRPVHLLRWRQFE